MITREPTWLNNNNTNWGFPFANKGYYIKDLLFTINCIFKLCISPIWKLHLKRNLKAYNKKKIALGSGKEVKNGWIGLDYSKFGKNVYPVNLLFSLPFSNNLIDEILAEHILEHFHIDDIRSILSECYRILKKEGIIRIISPDANYIAKLIIEGRNIQQNKDLINDINIHRWKENEFCWFKFINRLSHQWGEHKSLINKDMVTLLLNDVGFNEIYYPNSIKESLLFKEIPDIHSKRFPNESLEMNFVIEAKK
jgi:predicted SAM-dependent methyltransferase